MITITGKVLRIDESTGEHHKFEKYILIQTDGSGKVGIQVRQNDLHKIDMLDEGDFLDAMVHFEHSSVVANNGKGKTYYHNNVILDHVND